MARRLRRQILITRDDEIMTYALGKKTFRNILFAVIAGLGVALSVFISALSYRADKDLMRAQFTEATENRYSTLKRELESNLDALTSLQALYYASKEVEKAEFRDFSSHILKQHASIQALEWIPRVPDSRREAYERAARVEGFPDFQITERVEQGKMKRAKRRKEYFPVYFVEPYKGNEIAFGFDLASSPTRLEALTASGKTGEMLATARITLVQEKKNQFGFIVFAPVYGKKAVLNSDRAREAALEGFALGVFRIEDIVVKATSYLKPEGVDFSIYDASAPEKERILYTHVSRTRKTPMMNKDQPETGLRETKMLEVAGRKWQIIYSATPGFIAARRSSRPWIILFTGLALTGLIAGFLYSSARHAERAKRAAAAIEASEKKLKALFNAVNDAIMIIDPSGRILDVNNVTCERLGYSRDELLQMTPRDFDTPEYAAKVAERLAEVRLAGSAIFETAWVTRDGRIIPIEISARAIDYDGRPAFLSVARDLTERKKMEDELKESNIFTGQVISSAGEGIIVYGRDLRYQVWNPYMERLTGLPADKVVGEHPLTFFPFLRETGVLECLQKTLEGLVADAVDFQYSIPGTGRSGWVSHTEAPLQNAKGEIIGVIATVSDITERKQAEEAMRNSEERFRNLVESTSDWVWEVDENARYTYVSPKSKDLLGYGPEEILGKTPFDFMQPEEARRVADIFGPIAAAQQPIVALENTNLHKNGGLVVIETSGVPVFDSNRKFRGYRGIDRDITERKRIEEALLKSEEFNRSILESVDEGFIVIDRDYRIVSANRAFTEQTGMALEEITGKLCFEISHHCIAPCWEDGKMCAVKQVFDTGETRSVVHTHYDVKRAPIYVETKAYPLSKDESGKVMTVIEIIVDVTERRRAEETLAESEHKYRTLLENIPQKIFYKDRNSVYISCNRIFADDLKISPAEIAGKTDYDFFPKELAEKYRADDKRLMELGKTEDIEEKYIQDGQELWVHTMKTAVKDNSGRIAGILGVFWDITEYRKLEAQLRHAQKMEAVGTLAGGVAHDFNNILNVIIGYGVMLLDRLGDDHLSKEQLNEVLAAADRAANLTKRLLAFSRKQAMEMKPVNVNAIVAGMEKMLSRIIGEDIALTMELTAGKLPVMADAGQIEQVLMNLVSNARDAMPKGGELRMSTAMMEVDIAYIAVHGYGKAGPYALISVTDTGGGMDAETQKKIFEPFFTTKGLGAGTGLGLAIAYGIIKQHDGYIQVYSEVGKGTTFKILLPIIEEGEAKEGKIEAAAPAKGGTETILLAEDEASLRKLMRIVLEAVGYSVITAEDGEEAITKYSENRDKIQLLVLDMIMPKKNGKEAYEEIKKINPEARALFASGYTMDVIHKRELLEAGMDFILKPVSPKDLVRKVREALDR
jgi:PAS domain S-box-containing protein